MSEWPEGYGLRILDEVDSTLNEAARIAHGLSGPEWILAHRQTAARGRRGRAWVDTGGNLAATLVLFPKEPAGTAALRSFVASLALHDACKAVGGAGCDLTLKWPNDVLVNGGKLAGILLESAGQGGSLAHLAIGVGVNLAAAPEPEDVEAAAVRPVSLFGETGVKVAPERFLMHLAAAYAGHENRFLAHGFEPIRTLWLARAARLGEVVTARTVASETVGTFETVDPSGNLILNTAKGRVAIAAADVFF
ncbi:biotin--[acetyl-CoA-carboxylase] ligase [Sedimentitalea sp. JM2-8]|uniref:biotin--[biotin carboxyl-carrier protein] ligase n=1 Tax=Sedimentitalea xiamensis TaxID=3050037 RepID=A0ABT7FBB7_9RHOB|nr:biotin--[acetyl-CoA-carboxylase] ligase [Sedimentitalea xiamensis]MDK3072398.1 biotin--[acetyl-CoA-carboxylase] ligase [Sedimentitalea xiamensis]